MSPTTNDRGTTEPANADLQLADRQARPGGHQRPRALAVLVRAADAGPRVFYWSAVLSLAVTCLLAVAIAFEVRPPGPLPSLQRQLIVDAGVGLCLALAAAIVPALLPAARRRWLDRLAAPEQRAAVWLSLTVWFPFLLAVAYLWAHKTVPSTTVWISFGFLDKRWITGLYLLGVLAPMLLLVAASRVLAAGRGHPATWRALLAALAPAAGRHRSQGGPATPESAASAGTGAHAPVRHVRSRRAAGGWTWLFRSAAARVSAKIATVVAIAWYFYGPPWYLHRTAGEVISYQEDVFLGGIQAISHGAVPYIGPAAEQYGPGAQLLSYLYMRHFGGFSVVGFRESWAMFQWTGASILFIAFVLALGYRRGLIAVLASVLIFPALRELGFVAGQTYYGYFGWSDPLRYAGVIALVLLLPAAVRRCPGWRGRFAAGSLGLVLGVTSYIAQENFLASIVGAVAVSALLLLSGTSSARSIATALLSALVGFAIVWIPVLTYYVSKGTLARFLHLYFSITEAVASGYSNTPFGGVAPTPAVMAENYPFRVFYYAVPFILAVVALLTVMQFRPFRVAQNWSRQRVTLAATVVAAILMYQGALLRSDASHLYGTEVIFPALAVTIATTLPRLLGAWRRGVLASAAVVLFVAPLLLLPHNLLSFPAIRSLAAAPAADRARLAAGSAPPTPATMAGARVGAGLAGSETCCSGPPVAMTKFIQQIDRIHAVVGRRRTYIVDAPGGYPGLVYFVASLDQAPTSVDLSTMVMTAAEEHAYMADFRSRVMPQTYAMLTTSLGAPEARDFRAAYPDTRIVRLAIGVKPYYALIRPR